MSAEAESDNNNQKITQETAVIEPESVSHFSGAQRVDDKVLQLLHQIEAGYHDKKSLKEQVVYYVIMGAAFVLGALVGNPALLPGVG